MYPRYESVFILFVFSGSIFFVPLCSIRSSFFLNFEQVSGVFLWRGIWGEKFWPRGVQEIPPPSTPHLPPGTRVGTGDGTKVGKCWDFPWLFSFHVSDFVFGFVALCSCEEGSCHLNLYTDTVAQLKKKAASEQICLYMNLIRHLRGAQVCGWCCQGYRRFMRHSLWL